MSKDNEISVNGKCAYRSLSQWKGSPHRIVPIFVPTPRIEALLTVASLIDISYWKLTILGNEAQPLCPGLSY